MILWQLCRRNFSSQETSLASLDRSHLKQVSDMFISRNFFQRNVNDVVISITKWLFEQPQIESIKTTSLETVDTRVLNKNKENNLRSKDKAKKSSDVFRRIQLHMSKYQVDNVHLQSIISKPTAQLFKHRFPKGGPTYRRQVVNSRHQTPQRQSFAKPETPL